MAWSLVAIFSMSSIASSGVFNLIFPLAKASRSCLEWGRKPSMNMFNWIGSLNPSVGVLQSRPRNQSWASLSDSSRLGEMKFVKLLFLFSLWRWEMLLLLFEGVWRVFYTIQKLENWRSQDGQLWKMKEVAWQVHLEMVGKKVPEYDYYHFLITS